MGLAWASTFNTVKKRMFMGGIECPVFGLYLHKSRPSRLTGTGGGGGTFCKFDHLYSVLLLPRRETEKPFCHHQKTYDIKFYCYSSNGTLRSPICAVGSVFNMPPKCRRLCFLQFMRMIFLKVRRNVAPLVRCMTANRKPTAQMGPKNRGNF